jgi:ADP-ribose pyrophosphatase YjhB (NUDIX family)
MPGTFRVGRGRSPGAQARPGAPRRSILEAMKEPAILARGHWPAERVHARWHEQHYEPPERHAEAADAAITALRERGSPSHDGISARLVAHAEEGDRLLLELQPARWALRLVEGDASLSMAALTVTRDADGRWLAGRRAPWLSSWPGRWALGAGGAVDLGESPAHTLVRELQEEWGVAPERLTVEALVRLPHELVMVVGLAWLAPGAQLTMDDEHDACAWWPADVEQWPAEADEPLRRMATLLAAGL